jgi:hypothetical protein
MVFNCVYIFWGVSSGRESEGRVFGSVEDVLPENMYTQSGTFGNTALTQGRIAVASRSGLMARILAGFNQFAVIK